MTDIPEILGGISVILVFITIAMNFIYPEIESTVAGEPNERDSQNTKNVYKKDIKNIIKYRMVPFATFIFILIYICLPRSFEIFCNSVPSLWRFDLKNTLFIFIEIIMIAMLLINVFVIAKLYNRIKKNNKI
ncbi:MAG: hypothetical protein HQ510_04720 [Candidatus Marinimicrobia bacterium]|nr:hypothetical protein [Candidatus Neomarinimicrobiota bacterium]